jgi:hypothetical protein
VGRIDAAGDGLVSRAPAPIHTLKTRGRAAQHRSYHMKLFDAGTASAASEALLKLLPTLAGKASAALVDAEGLAAFYSKTHDHAKHERFSRIGSFLADFKHGLAAV